LVHHRQLGNTIPILQNRNFLQNRISAWPATTSFMLPPALQSVNLKASCHTLPQSNCMCLRGAHLHIAASHPRSCSPPPPTPSFLTKKLFAKMAPEDGFSITVYGAVCTFRVLGIFFQFLKKLQNFDSTPSRSRLKSAFWFFATFQGELFDRHTILHKN
jgi:hypothetical protein